MKKLLTGLVVGLMMLGVVSKANAILMSIGNDLVYDDSLNKVWLSDQSVFNGSSSYFESIYLLGSLENRITLNGDIYNLTWRTASSSEVTTLNFAESVTRELFTPRFERYADNPGWGTGGPWSGPAYEYLIYGAVGDIITGHTSGGEYYTDIARYAQQVWVDLSNPDNTVINWDEMDFSLQSTNDSSIIFAVADLQPVPEPVTFILMVTGLAGLIGVRKWKKA